MDVGLRIIFLELSIAIEQIELTLLKQKGDFMADAFTLIEAAEQLLATDQNELAVRIGDYQDRIAALQDRIALLVAELEATKANGMTPEQVTKLLTGLNQIHLDFGALAPPLPPLAASTARKAP